MEYHGGELNSVVDHGLLWFGIAQIMTMYRGMEKHGKQWCS